MRSTFWDCVKGAAIVAVVIIHASGATLQAPQSSANWSGGLILNQCADFAVPLFLAISGLFARYDGNSPLHFYAKRFQRLIGPYVLWSLIYIAITHTREFLLPLEVAEDILEGKGIGIGYFVPLLAQFIILTPLFARLRSEKMHFATMIVSGCLGLAYAYVVRLYLPNTMLGEFRAMPSSSWSGLHSTSWVSISHAILSASTPSFAVGIFWQRQSWSSSRFRSLKAFGSPGEDLSVSVHRR
jgi:surface polysaccharide O-acyltransferase-like enzyme